MSDKCERCGKNFAKMDNWDVCGVCLDEIELDRQYEEYVEDCQGQGEDPLPYEIWVEIGEEDP
ncbi:hypothetical protein J40TS1_34290 [Paenibacillus montaniterrae]|uniref:Uncharacterized protein n=1 Tax=Paenibacillus montaniterrae TaxID=429341 RepID=A0A919YR77_9BACL|nr:hypothetical protein [Paenibacillus montaniterrae]GIP17787.1 hypothetical protein J40TS1_34290 [Paenibacillus montaniterrae]